MEFKELLKEFLRKSEAGEVPVEDLIYCSNLLENFIIDMFLDGKISQEQMDRILYDEPHLKVVK